MAPLHQVLRIDLGYLVRPPQEKSTGLPQVFAHDAGVWVPGQRTVRSAGWAV